MVRNRSDFHEGEFLLCRRKCVNFAYGRLLMADTHTSSFCGRGISRATSPRRTSCWWSAKPIPSPPCPPCYHRDHAVSAMFTVWSTMSICHTSPPSFHVHTGSKHFISYVYCYHRYLSYHHTGVVITDVHLFIASSLLPQMSIYNNNNNNRIQRRYSRFFTISSQRRELSPTRTLKWPGRNRVQITCNTSSAYHVQVSCYVPLGTMGQLRY